VETDSAENAERILRRLEVSRLFCVWKRTKISFRAIHDREVSIQTYYINNVEMSILWEPSPINVLLESTYFIDDQLYLKFNQYVHSQRNISANFIL